MYARYIPSKKAAPPAVPAQPVPGVFHHNPARPVPQPAAIARPFPPPVAPPPLKRKIVFDDDDMTASPFQAAVISAKRDPTPDRASKRLKQQASGTEARGSTADKKPKDHKEQTDEPAEAEEAVGEDKKKKRKRRHKKAANDGPGDGEAENEQKPAEDVPMTTPPPETEQEVDKTEKTEKTEKKRMRKRRSKGAKTEEEEEKEVLKEEETQEPSEKAAEKTPKEKKEPKEKSKKTVAAADSAPAVEEPKQVDGPDEMPARFRALLEKKNKSLQRTHDKAESAADGEAEPEEPRELHGLEPLPQPAPVAAAAARLAYDTLPRWLAEPMRVPAGQQASFASMGIFADDGDSEHGQAARVLADKGWTEAFAVQTAVIPMLLPSRQRRGDLVIAAATGSGKTLAYVLPIVRDLCREVAVGGAGRPRLRAVVVVPTRELVQQVHDVCETCARAFARGGGGRRVRVGVAMGSQSFRREQAVLVEAVAAYDPAGYRAAERQRAAAVDGMLAPAPAACLPDHVVRHVAGVDLLVSTPGRLVEHLQSTSGFTLAHVRWLVVDEADKLLGQSYQQWLAVVMEALDTTAAAATRGDRDFADSAESGVRKVVLSATMTRDVSLLRSLRLRRPRHVVLEGTHAVGAGVGEGEGGGETAAAEYVLPQLLQESAVKVRDEAQKPLYLVDLLYETGLLGSDDESEEDSDTSDDSDNSQNTTPREPSPHAATALIFTRSNENALRLSRLLALLVPALAARVGTLTSTTRTSERRRTLRAFAAGRVRILVATDLAARGIDLPQLDHVINYDMPPSIEFYVHRVGRTARAGRPGHTWTLFTKREAGWFWPEVAGQGGGRSGRGRPGAAVVQRSGKVGKVVLGGHDEEDDDEAEEAEAETETAAGSRQFSEARVAAYEAALAQLGKEARA